MGKRAWHRVLPLCQSLPWLETAHRKQTSKGSSVSPEFSPIVNAGEGREPGTTWIFVSPRCFRTVLQWQLSVALEILDLQFLNTEAKENMPDSPRREQSCCQAEKTVLKKTRLHLSEECALGIRWICKRTGISPLRTYNIKLHINSEREHYIFPLLWM